MHRSEAARQPEPEILMDAELLEKFEKAVRGDGRYPPEAFEFLHRGLDLATRQKHAVPPRSAEPAAARLHVTGQELCEALRGLAVRQWGPLAREVLRRWNIHGTRDFGQMVYLMIGVGLMGKQDSDDVADFDNVYDFAASFATYEIPLDDAPLESDAD